MRDTSGPPDRPDIVRGHSAGELDLTVIVPAYNEEQSIADTIRSLQQQTVVPREILVVDDFSSDRTGEIAKACGATVLRPPRNTGSKAGAQNFALAHVKTDLTMAIDADTTLASDAIEKLLPALEDESVAAVCGFVIPRYVETLWERGRYVEYLLAFTWYKPIQDYCDHPLISSGCFSMYRTKILKENGGWSTRTLAEDMDLTWSFYQRGYKVRFVHDAVCYPIEPHDLFFMRKQLKRWSHGFAQNLKLHWEGILEIPYLRSFIMVALWDAVLASVAYLILIPLLAVLFSSPILLIGYVIDIPVLVVPVLYTASLRKETMGALASIPSFFVLRTVNSFFLLEALVTELLFGRSLRTYEKGH
jgi:cellulose synthase/poly-beta-1,6-N-acetylglucosamine synthase-like glycosyltransferase